MDPCAPRCRFKETKIVNSLNTVPRPHQSATDLIWNWGAIWGRWKNNSKPKIWFRMPANHVPPEGSQVSFSESWLVTNWLQTSATSINKEHFNLAKIFWADEVVLHLLDAIGRKKSLGSTTIFRDKLRPLSWDESVHSLRKLMVSEKGQILLK